MKKIIPILFFLGVTIIFFWQVIFRGFLPIPTDTLVGLYNPFRDLYRVEYPRGIPFKNFLITDPIREQYVWRFLGISLEKQNIFPIWNPYNGLGMPLLANQQSALLYPFNILYLLIPFAYAWSIQIMLSVFLSGFFTYSYLRSLKRSQVASVFAGTSFAFSGFVMSWLEWNTLVQTILWLPLILWTIENIFSNKLWRKKIIYATLGALGLVFSFFAGHLQTFFYVLSLVAIYYLLKVFSQQQKTNYLFLFVLLFSLSILFSLILIVPTLQLISLSARSIDLDWTKPGWFIPIQHLVQFLIPDFFGNPSTLNYWGVWNYGEMVGYIGVIPLVFAFLGSFAKRKIVYFFIGAILLSLLFATQNPIAVLPFVLHIPFLSTAQPTRLISLIDFSLVVLVAFGIDSLENIGKKQIIIIIIFFSLAFLGVWVFILVGNNYLHFINIENLDVVKRNSYLPTGLFLFFLFGLLVFVLTKKKHFNIVIIVLLLLSTYDVMRFGTKFNSFTQKPFLYPSTATIDFLQNHLGSYRYMTTDDRILPPNVGAYYKISSLDVYDPLYLKRYGEFMAAFQRNIPNISTPFGFNRIIAPHNISSPFINLLGVKYILSLSDIQNKEFKKIFQEGETKVYENTKVFNLAFFVKNIIGVSSKQDDINEMYKYKNEMKSTATVEGVSSQTFESGNVEIISNTPEKIILKTTNDNNGFLVLSDMYYPTWNADIDGVRTKIYPSDYVLRGIFVPKGNHTIAFNVKLF